MEIIRLKDRVLFDLGYRRLIYPLNTAFLHELNSHLVGKWIQAGWNIDKTVFLEIDFPTIPIGESLQEATPSDIFAGVVIFWNRKKYYRIVVFSKDFFRSHQDLVLRIDTWHEKQHLVDIENYMQKGMKPRTEDEIVKMEIEHVLKIFGEKGFETRRDSVLSDGERLKNADAMPGFFTIPWLKEYIGEFQRKYTIEAIAIPPTEYAEEVHNSLNSPIENIMKVYRIIGEDATLLFDHTLSDL